MLTRRNAVHSCGSVPSADFPSSAAGDEDEDGDAEQRHQQDGREDHQEKHVVIPLLLRLERDLFNDRQGESGGQIRSRSGFTSRTRARDQTRAGFNDLEDRLRAASQRGSRI